MIRGERERGKERGKVEERERGKEGGREGERKRGREKEGER